jgi:tetratricopeptide (TPR) repeat protein
MQTFNAYSKLVILAIIFSSCGTGSHYSYYRYYSHRCNNDAIERLKAQEEERPWDWKVNYWRGMCLTKNKEYHRAINDFKEAMKKEPRKKREIDQAMIWVYYYLAKDFYHKAQFDSASFYYEKIFSTKNPMELPDYANPLWQE